ncbi:1793_t:CDS:2 [Cetraspora pellucida]|uniref:1793_t:CDS:1 n=1 Tax=Cetraspora pellucida TaxID=1433469 RepID=A0A9N9BZH1_9GLOM|nr:1793_t:CDS:2 [Cetraspora pellucida]
MFNHQFINNDHQNGSPSSSKVIIQDKNNMSFMGMSNDHLRSEIGRRAIAVVEAYEELGSACRRAEYAVSQLKALLPPDANVVLPSDASIPSFPSTLHNKPPQNLDVPISYDRNINTTNMTADTSTSSVNTTTAGINDDNMVASLLMSLTNASWERNPNPVESDKGGHDTDDINMIDNSSYVDHKPLVIKDQSSPNTRSSNRNRSRRKPSTGKVPYSTQFTPEEILFLDEFNKLYEKRVQLGPTRQSDIASEIRQFANNAIAFGQPAVSGLVRKTKVPKEQRAVNALKAWIESGKKRLGVV